jgi:hypothetical protein
MSHYPSAADIARSFRNAKRSGHGFLVPCPVPSHGKGRGDWDPSLSIRDGDNGLVVFNCFGACDPADVRHHAIALGWVRDRDARPARQWKPQAESTRRDEARDDERRAERARAIWEAASPATGTLVATYLSAARGIPGPAPQSLRFHPNVWHAESRQELPAMIACAVCHGVGVTGVHITYLQAEGTGKAAVSPAKRMIGTIKGSGVWLHDEHEPYRIVVAEGVETALSVQAATGIPAVAALSAYFLPHLLLPASVHDVLIAADPGNVGEEWASRAADRWHREGRSVSIALPRGNT